MAVQHLSSIDPTGPALLLGPGGDLDLVGAGVGVGPDEDDGDGPGPVALALTGDAGERIGPGVVLVHLGPATAAHPAVRDAARRGVVAVVAGPVAEAVAAAAALVTAGADPDRVAVEVVVGPGPVGDTVERFLEAGATVGADVPPRLAVTLDPPPGTDEERAAWEIGALTRVLSGPHPARIVRGADPARFRRVREVVAAVDGGGGS